MFISQMKIQNYRNFLDEEISFQEGLNVLIGPNNSGKSNILRCLSIIWGEKRRQLSIDDICDFISLDVLKKEAPVISIEIVISQSDNENLLSDDLATVANWLTKLENPYEAKLKYVFFLPEKYVSEYPETVKEMKSCEEIRSVIKERFIRYYTSKIYVGNPENQTVIDFETLSKFDFQFLDAIRDVDRDMGSGRNALLKNVMEFFMDYEIKSDSQKSDDTKKLAIEEKKKTFKKSADELVKNLRNRISAGKKEVLAYSSNIGVSFDNSVPDFIGNISENDVLSLLQLIIKHGDESSHNLPVANNGLGYNNLIFMSLLLSKMQVDSNGDYLGSNAKVFPMLAVEEPEAHLQPTMQFHFIDFLRSSLTRRKVRQVFVTSHSPHLVSAVRLDELICLYKVGSFSRVGYPGKTFKKNKNSKKYVQRFLDATKSNLFFAEKVILVEGIAEQLLLPVFAKYIGKSLEKEHVAIVNVGGRYFEHFLRLFNTDNNEYAINRKIAVITDRDPQRRKKSGDSSCSRFYACYPYEYNNENDKYDYAYNQVSDSYSKNIKYFMQDEKTGKTLEYQLAFDNVSNILITSSIKNHTELEDLIKKIQTDSLDDVLDILSNTEENKRIRKSIRDSNWNEDDKKKSVFASRYLNSVDKGVNALELSVVLQDNLDLGDSKKEFNIPKYIKDAIWWICDDGRCNNSDRAN